MDNARVVILEMKAEENKLLQKRTALAVSSARTTTSVVGLGSILAFGLTSLVPLTIDRDIVKRKQVEEALRLRDRAIGSASGSILIAGPLEKDNPIIYTNPAFERLTGYTSTEVLGHNCCFLQGSGTDQDAVNQIVVAVNGIRFAQKDKERIFNVFERLHRQSEYQGTGIGLSICRKIVERHGGTIIAESTSGQGATFTITLPNLKEYL